MRLKKYFPLFSLLLLIVINIFLINLPLFRYFSFEFCVANAIAISFLSGWFYLFNVERKFYLLLLLVPLAFGIYLSTKFEMCSFIDGLEFYLVFTLPSALIGAGLGAFANLNCSKVKFLLFPFFFCLLLFSFLVEIYFRPNIYFFNSIIGFFPGTIYDESLQLAWKHYSYRILNVIFFSAVILVDQKIQIENSLKRWRYLPFIFVGVIFYLLKPGLGFSTDQEILEANLPYKFETDNFIVHSASRFDETEEIYLRLLHEFYFEELKIFFKTSPKRKIYSYIFKDEKQKRELIGAGNADLAKPWRNEIFLSVNSFERSLKHEIAHLFAAAYSTNFFRVPASFNSALIEGIAVAAEGNYAEEEIYSLVNLAEQNGFGISIEKLFSGLNFFGQTSTRSYLFAGAFLKFLLEKYGMDKVRRIYDDEPVEQVFGKNISSLEKEFRSKLKSINFQNNKAKAKYYFGRKSMLQKVCPRFIANKTDKVFQLLSEKNYEEADLILAELLKYSDDYNLIFAKVEVLKHQKKYDETVKIIESAIDRNSGTPYYYLLQLQLADLHSINRQTEEAELLYDSLVVHNPHIRLKYLSALRISLSNSSLLERYLAADDSTKLNYILDSLSTDASKWSVPSLITLKNYLSTEKLKKFYHSFAANFDCSDFDWNYSALKMCELGLQKNLVSESEILYRMINGAILLQTFESIYNEVGRRINYFARRKNHFNQ